MLDRDLECVIVRPCRWFTMLPCCCLPESAAVVAVPSLLSPSRSHPLQMLDRDLEEAEEQYSLAVRSHMLVVDNLLDLQVGAVWVKRVWVSVVWVWDSAAARVGGGQPPPGPAPPPSPLLYQACCDSSASITCNEAQESVLMPPTRTRTPAAVPTHARPGG